MDHDQGLIFHCMVSRIVPVDQLRETDNQLWVKKNSCTDCMQDISR